MDTNNKVYIQNFWFVNNYGACLTAYSLYNILININYKPYLIDASNYGEKLTYIFRDFIKKYCKTINANIVRNMYASTFITGSDQVFRPKLTKENFSQFMLNFVPEASKKISFSASFGVDKNAFLRETNEKIINQMQTSLNSFDYVSVREKSGVTICRDIFDIKADWIIDPVFILSKEYFKKLAAFSNKKYPKIIASCMFDKKNKKLDKFLSKKYGYRVIEMHNSNFTIEDWLNIIMNCEFLITNSYHAMCFAIIFNKPFICLSKDTGAAARFASLFEMLSIENQSIDSIYEIYKKDCIFKINYKKVNEKIEEEREKGLDFLKKALEAPNEHFEEKQNVRKQYFEDKIYELEKKANLKYQLKQLFWNIWLIIFHKFLPETVKILIRKLRENENAYNRK